MPKFSSLGCQNRQKTRKRSLLILKFQLGVAYVAGEFFSSKLKYSECIRNVLETIVPSAFRLFYTKYDSISDQKYLSLKGERSLDGQSLF